MKNKGIRYDEERKKCIIDSYRDGDDISLLSKKHNITRATIYKWIKEYSQTENVSNKEYETLKNQLEKLKIENEILKKSNDMLLMENKSEILDFINIHKNEYDIALMCQVFEIPRSTYYKLTKNENNEKSKKSVNNDKTKNTDLNIHSSKNEESGFNKETVKKEVSEEDEEKEIIRDSNVYNIAIFNEIDFKKIKYLKAQLRSKYKIKTKHNFKMGYKTSIEEIYNHCLKKAKAYTWPNIKKKVLNINEDVISQYEKDWGSIFNNDEPIENMYNAQIQDDKIYENAIRDHCIILSLYTVEYLLQKPWNVKISHLGHRIKGMGYNFFSTNNYYKNKFKFDYDNYLKFNKLSRDESAFPKKIDEVSFDVNNFNRGDSISKKIIYNADAPILNNIIDLKTEEISVPLFLSNFSYSILENSSTATSIEKRINDLDKCNANLSKDNLFDEKKKIVDDYKKWAKGINYYEKFNEPSDKILFEFEKERQLNIEFIRYCEDSGILNNDTYVDLNIIKATMSFPNIFSRNTFIELFLFLSCKYGYYIAEDMVDKLYKETFPILEKNFFISLFEYCKKSQDINVHDVLQNMDSLLKDYIETNYDRIMNSWKIVIKKDSVSDSGKSIDNDKVYSLIEFNFKYLFHLRDDLTKDYR